MFQASNIFIITRSFVQTTYSISPYILRDLTVIHHAS